MNNVSKPSVQDNSILVSACLLGLPTRYDGHAKHSVSVLEYLQRRGLLPIPVCPEQLAGLSTPRPKTFFKKGNGDDVLSGSGLVVNEHDETMNTIFLRGANMTLQVARLCHCRQALLKERSPSCGVHQIYLQDKKVAGRGVTAAILAEAGIKVFSEDDLK